MQQCALDHADQWPTAAETVQKDFYVDDVFSGANDPQTASILAHDLSRILAEGQFELTKRASNDSTVLSPLKGTSRTVELTESNDDAKVLGLRWVTAADCLTFRVINNRCICSTQSDPF